MQKERFKRPDPGFSMYEGRTRGKRMKYTYSDDEDISFSDSMTTRRSARHTGTTTPAETGPITTSSGRQVRAPTRLNVSTGDSATSSVKGESPEYEAESVKGANGRPKRSAASANGRPGSPTRTREQMLGSDEEESEGDLGDDEEDADEHVPEESDDEDEFDEDEAMVDDDLDDTRQSLVVKLSVTPPKLRTVLSTVPGGEVDGPITVKSLEGTKGEAPDPPPRMSPEPLSSDVERTVEVKPASMVKLQEAKLESAPPPMSPSSMPATSLALRGSPEKVHERPKALAISLDARE
jgi:hypothetical protein